MKITNLKATILLEKIYSLLYLSIKIFLEVFFTISARKMLQKTHFREMAELSPDETVTPEVFDRQTISQERLHAYQEQVRTNRVFLL